MAYSPDAIAQTTIKTRITLESPLADTTLFLGDWVVESTIFLAWHPDGEVFNGWRFDSNSGRISISVDSVETGRSLEISFESLPISLPRSFILNPRIEYVPPDSNQSEVSRDIRRDSEDVFSSDLNQSGSLSRGIIVGSNQDFALESGLQFELNGQLTEDIYLDAVLTDQSIPIQPDGTTQSIREFDKVLIRLRSENASLEMGDVDVSLQQSTFAKLNRRLQGASGNFQSGSGSATAALSTIRGTFLTKQFTGADGVQGPYRLTGKNGEEFIIVLAGTERVYINGAEVQRGEENEYIIDYGLGEITFTNNLFIKDETRIFVEYEYIDQDFSRTLIAAEARESFFDDRFQFGVSVIRQADGDDLLSQQTLSEQDIRLLELVGDDLNAAIVSGVITNPDDDEINIQYARIDTVFNAEIFSIFKNIPGDPSSNLVVRFSNVGEGNGSYRRIGDAINGLLYEWVGPGNGAYEPFRQLPAPQKHQMFAINTGYSVTDKITFSGEFAVSDFDQNRFSSLDNGDNRDFAFESGLSAKGVEVGIGQLDLEYLRRQSGNNFEFFERTREVEFDRKWNLQQPDVTGESLDELEANINFSELSKIGVGIGRLTFSGFESVRQNSSLNILESRKLSLSYQQEFISSENRIINQDGNWFRQIGRIESQISKSLKPFVLFEHEDRREKDETARLLSSSLRFYEIGPGLGFDSNNLSTSASIIFRKEKSALNGTFQDEAEALEQRYKLDYFTQSGFRTSNKVNFRLKKFTNDFQQLGRSDQDGFQLQSSSSYQQDNFSARISYQANTERRALQQEAYIEVGPELGQFVWIDENGNGIQEIDEFFPELSPNEGTYVLQYLPSDDLLSVVDLNTRLGIDWEPFNKTSANPNSSSWLRTLKLNTRIDLRENSTTDVEGDVLFLRVNTFRNDSTTLRGLFRWEQGLELDPTERLNVKVSYSTSENLNRRTSELQEKKSEQFFLESRYLTSDDLRLTFQGAFGSNRTDSDQLQNRTFDIQYFSITPGFIYRFSRSAQYGFQASYSYKEDQYPDIRTNSTLLKVSNTNRFFLWDRIQANSLIELRNVNLKGETNSFSRFELTEGTGTGTNLVWSMSAVYRFNNLVRLNFTYDGRTVQNRPDIHTIKMVVSAVF